MKLPPRENWFQYILGFSALFAASIAAFFSVMGIGMLFSGAAISAMLMASSLELGKIMATSFLSRYWKTATKFLRIYLSIAVAVLVVITSFGVFGWLSSAYQSSAIKYEMAQQQVLTLTEQKETINNQVSASQKRLDALVKIRNDQENRMNDALNNPSLSRNPTALRQVQEQNISLIKSTNEDIRNEKETYNAFVNGVIDMDKKIFETKSDTSKTKDIVTFKFVADAFGWELNSTVKWFIVFIIIVFDPLAVSLILAYNVVLSSNKNSIKVESTDKIISTDPIVEEEIVKEATKKAEPIEPIAPPQSAMHHPPHAKHTGELRDNELAHTPNPHTGR